MVYRFSILIKYKSASGLLELSIVNAKREKTAIFEMKCELGIVGFYWGNKMLYVCNHLILMHGAPMNTWNICQNKK